MSFGRFDLGEKISLLSNVGNERRQTYKYLARLAPSVSLPPPQHDVLNTSPESSILPEILVIARRRSLNIIPLVAHRNRAVTSSA